MSGPEIHIFAIKTIQVCGRTLELKEEEKDERNSDLADEFYVRDGDVLDVVIDLADPEDPESITVRVIQRRAPDDGGPLLCCPH